MSVIGRGSGMGRLIEQDGSEAEVNYTFTVVQRGGMKSGDGTMTTESRTAFHNAFMAGQSTLEFEDGRRATVIVTQVNSGGARFVFSGPIPGY